MQGCVEPARQLGHGPGALDIGGPLRGLVGADVIDGSAVHHMVDVSQLGHGAVRQVQVGRNQVADEGFCPLTPVGGQVFEAAQ